MTSEVVDLRTGDRFTVAEPITGTFGAAEVAVLNLGLGGVQLSHPHPLRIGTRARLWFKRGDVTAAITATIVLSHLASTSAGMTYRSGAKLDEADPAWALAINSLIRGGALQHDTESLQRKQQRMREREEARRSQVRILPTITDPPA